MDLTEQKSVIRLISLFIMFIASTTAADSVPRCWLVDQPGADIQDGLFRVFIPTQDHSAGDVAKALAIAGYSLAAKTAVGADSPDRIEIDLYGETKYWQPTAAFPTIASFKDAIVKTIEPLTQIEGVTVQCALNSHHHGP